MQEAKKLAEATPKNPDEIAFLASDLNKDGGVSVDEWSTKYKELVPDADDAMLS